MDSELTTRMARFTGVVAPPNQGLSLEDSLSFQCNPIPTERAVAGVVAHRNRGFELLEFLHERAVLFDLVLGQLFRVECQTLLKSMQVALDSSTHLFRNIILTNQSFKYRSTNGTSGVVTASGLKGHSPKPGTLKDCG